MRATLNILLLLVVWGAAPGCNWLGGFRPAEVIKHPDAPILIAEVKNGYVRAYVYDKAKNEMTDYGWVQLENSNAKGWSLLKYDWENYILQKAKARGTGPR